MEVMFVDTKWKGDISFNRDVIAYLKDKKIKSVALFASVQFLDLDRLIKQLKELKIKVLTTKAKRTDKEIQILGCDTYHDSFAKDIIKKADLTIYVGDGLFHPQALIYSQIGAIKDILVWNPVNRRMSMITKREVLEKLKRLKANLRFYMLAKTIGIIVTTKPGQQFLNNAFKLKAKLEKENKKAFVFLADTLDTNGLEDFTFIDAWVNTACPRIGFDDITNIRRPLININHAYDAAKIIDRLSSF